MAFPVVVSFFTSEWEYPEHARRLQAECDALGLKHAIEERPSTNDYKKNTRIKPFYIREQLKKLKKPVLWLDVDSSILGMPDELFKAKSYDMAAVRMREDNKLKRLWQVGVLFFNYTTATIEFLDRWCDAATSGTDEGAFEYAYKNLIEPLRILELDRTRWYQVLRTEGQYPEDAICVMRIAKSDLKYETKLKDKAKAGSKAGTSERIKWTQQGWKDTAFGPSVGCGDTRMVYQDGSDDDKIIKHIFYKRNNHNANHTEWQVWQTIKDEPYAKYFAPCWDISECGSYLLMIKAPRNSRKFRDMAESLGSTGDRLDIDLLTDLPNELKDDIDRMHQWGSLEDRMVIIDYGSQGFLDGLQKLKGRDHD